MYFKANDFLLYYDKYVNKKNINTMVIFPGWGNNRTTFNRIIEIFKDNYNIYIVDYPGFGNSTFPRYDLTIYDYAEVMIDLFKKENITNPVIIAHSFGGIIATLLTGYYNLNISKMVFIDIAGIKKSKSLRIIIRTYIYKFLKKLRIFLPQKKKQKYLKKLQSIFASSDYNNLSNKMKKTFQNIVNEDLTKYYSNIKSEVLILWGMLDDVTPLKDAIKINKLIKNSSLIQLPNCTHFCYLEEVTLVINILKEFLINS